MRGVSLEKGCALLVSGKAGRYYFSGLDVDEGLLLIAEKTVYFLDARYYHAYSLRLKKRGIIPALYKDLSSVEVLLKEMQISALGVDFKTTTLDFYNKLKMLSAEIFDGGAAINGARQVKSEKEISLIRKACSITERAYKKALACLKEGVTELEIKKVIVDFYKSHGADGESFDTIVAFGKNSAVPHHKTGKTKLKQNSCVLIDTGCVYKGYCSDLTRTLFFGTPTEKFKTAYFAVLEAHETAKEKITAGTLTKDADGYARAVLKNYELDSRFTHSLGHGVGLEIHEEPFLSKKSNGVLRENTVFTIEPGVYFNKKFGIRIEDTVYISKGAVKSFYTLDKNLKIL